MFQTALGKAPKRYSQVVDENRITAFRQQSSLFFSLYFKFGSDNLVPQLPRIVSTTLNSIDNKLRLLNLV